MSDGAAAQREHPGCVLGVFTGLLVLLGAAAALFLVRGGAVDGEAAVAEIFRGGTPPFGLELVEASALPGKEVVYRLERPEPVEGSEPDELLLVRYPDMRALARLFPVADGDDEGEEGGASREASENKLRWDEDPSFSFTAVMQAGSIEWERWRADYAVLRAYQESGSWRDSVKVNLGQEERPLALFLLWPEETPYSEDDLQRLLRSIEMLAPTDDQG